MKNEGKKCVFCNSQDIHIEDVKQYDFETNVGKGIGQIEYTCENCGKHWCEEG